ncbi:MAG: paraquat-inducible protein A [Pseudomonadota bacterium]
MTELAGSRMVCHECDLIVDVPALALNDKAFCPRCSYLLASNRPNAFSKMLAYSVTALIFLALANAFPFLSLTASGQEQSVTLPGSVAILFDEDHVLLSGIVFAAIIGVPAVLLFGIMYVSIAIRLPGGLPGARRALRWSLNLIPWSMAEIFLIGILVSFIKIVALANVALGLSFWAYVLFTVFMLLVFINIDRREVWRRVQAVRRG